MSGHSKWASIKHKKGAADAKRGKLFTKVIREITTAARAGGGDPDGNARLRSAILAARAINMPKSNVENAIKKGTGEIKGESYDEANYEGYGPGGTAVLVETMSDNKKRTAAEIRHIFSKFGGNLGESGCVNWMFHKRGLIQFSKDSVTEDKLMELALDAGAEDVKDMAEDNLFEVYTDASKFQTVKDAFDKAGFKYSQAEVTMLPQTYVKLSGKEAESMLKLIDLLEDNDDVQHVYANFDISASEMEKITI